MPHYINDMMHCSQETCKKKDSCYRYWLGMEAKKRGGIVSFYMPKEVKDNCDYYLELKDY